MKPHTAPQSAFVSWCSTCGTLDVADAKPQTPKHYTCRFCPVGEGRMHVGHYRHAPGKQRNSGRKVRGRN